MLFDLLLVFLAVGGLILLLWCFLGYLFRPVFEPGMVTFLNASGNGEHLEQQIRAYAWFRDGRMTGGRLVVVDRGLDSQGKKLISMLCETYDWLSCCDPSDTYCYIEG